MRGCLRAAAESRCSASEASLKSCEVFVKSEESIVRDVVRRQRRNDLGRSTPVESEPDQTEEP